MTKQLILALIAVTALGLSACKEEKTAQTETSRTVTTSDGTEIQTKTETDITIDEEGRRTGTVETETTVDPEGIMNKETTEKTREEIQ